MRQVIDARRWPDTIVAVYLSHRRVTSRVATQRQQRRNHGQVSLLSLSCSLSLSLSLSLLSLSWPLYTPTRGKAVIRAGRVEVSTWRGRVMKLLDTLSRRHRTRQTDAALTITLSYRLPLVIDADPGPGLS